MASVDAAAVSRRPLLDGRRLAIAIPVLLALAAVLFLLLRREDATATTPKAKLLDTPASAGLDIGVRKGQLARDFSAAGPTGEVVRLSDLRGRPVVLNFWATWCTSCLTEMPQLQEVQREFGPDRVAVIAVNSGESVDDAREFIDFLAADTFRYAFDPSLAVTDAYGVIGLSTSIFIDAGGVIRATYTGQLSQDLMREYIRASMASETAGEPPVKFRLPGSVEARTSVLMVSEPESGTVRMSSRRLRCDDSFCADAVADGLRALEGVRDLRTELGADPPAIEVDFDPGVATAGAVVAEAVSLVEALEDPLYQQPVEIQR